MFHFNPLKNKLIVAFCKKKPPKLRDITPCLSNGVRITQLINNGKTKTWVVGLGYVKWELTKIKNSDFLYLFTCKTKICKKKFKK